MEFTCAECGATAYFALEGTVMAFRTEVRVPPSAEARCKEREARLAQQGSDEFYCPHLDEALVRALEARREQGSRPQGDNG